jgi:hypothetical protein
MDVNWTGPHRLSLKHDSFRNSDQPTSRCGIAVMERPCAPAQDFQQATSKFVGSGSKTLSGAALAAAGITEQQLLPSGLSQSSDSPAERILFRAEED